MVRHSLGAAAICALLLVAPGAPGRAPIREAVAPSARAAAAAVDAFHAALRRGDTNAALALLADEALIFEDGRAERSKAEYALHHVGADSEYSKAVPAVATRRSGDSAGGIAWIATERRARGAFRGTDVNSVTEETMILRRVAGRWKIVHVHWSSAPSSVE
jgi:ketosteroid isomerase-like protein